MAQMADSPQLPPLRVSQAAVGPDVELAFVAPAGWLLSPAAILELESLCDQAALPPTPERRHFAVLPGGFWLYLQPAAAPAIRIRLLALLRRGLIPAPPPKVPEQASLPFAPDPPGFVGWWREQRKPRKGPWQRSVAFKSDFEARDAASAAALGMGVQHVEIVVLPEGRYP